MVEETEKQRSVLDALRAISQNVEGETVSVDSFSRGLGRRGYGLLLMTLVLPNLIPLPIPVLSMIFGLPLAFVGLQLLLGFARPWVPGFLLRQGIDKAQLLGFCDHVDERYGWIHRLIRPRLLFMFVRPMMRVIGAAIFVMAFVMVLPIPLGNLVLAIPIALLALGLVEKDGLFVLIGFVFGGLGLTFNLMVGLSVLLGAFLAISHFFGL